MNASRAPMALGLTGALGLGLIAGCVEPEAFPQDRGADSPRPKAGDTCTEDDCGPNSAFMNGVPVDELNVEPYLNSGDPNFAGVRLVGFIPPPSAPAPGMYYLFADNGELTAIDPASGETLRGQALVGGKLVLHFPGAPATESEYIAIQDYAPAPMWPPYESLDMPRYRLTYSIEPVLDPNAPISAFPTPICKAAIDFDDMTLAWAVVISGELYAHDPNGLAQPEIVGVQLGGWFNLVCQGNALFKAKRLGYDPAPDLQAAPMLPHAGWNKIAERLATLKMVTADYCGDNTSFTRTGTYVRWANRDGSIDNGPALLNAGACDLPAQPADTQIEAYWTAQGAACLRGSNHLRRPEWKRYTVNEACTGPDLPPCEGFQPPADWEWKTYVCP